jgi:hypothetical protein
MLTDTTTFFYETALKRTLEIGDKVVIRDKEYNELIEKKKRLFFAIEKALPDNCKNLIDEYDETLCEAQGKSEVLIYIQAFKDGRDIMSLPSEV